MVADRLNTKAYKATYERYVLRMSYAAKADAISYTQSLEALKRIIKVVDTD